MSAATVLPVIWFGVMFVSCRTVRNWPIASG